jgi:hypothetical protein
MEHVLKQQLGSRGHISMKTLNRSVFVLITALLLMSESAYGQQPPDVVVSDESGGTAMGTNALLNVQPTGYTPTGNTAPAYNALFANTTGYSNTASGDSALVGNAGCEYP